MEQQRGLKRQMVENDSPVVQGHQGQQHFQQPVATPALQTSLYQQDRMRQLQPRGRERLVRSYRHKQQKSHPGPTRLNEAQTSHQNLDARSSFSQPTYEPGKGALLVAAFLCELQNRAKDNNELFWRTFVVKFFAPGAKSRFCISNTSAVPRKDNWRCDICKHNPTNGLEVEFLPSLFRIKYESGNLEEIWYTGSSNEYENGSGQIILDYEKTTLRIICENNHVVHKGQLRVVLTPDLKISSWNFCVRQIEEFVPKSLINPQLVELGEAVQDASSDSSAQVLQDSLHRFLTPSLELAEILKPQALEINETLTGKTMEYNKRTGSSPTESLNVFLDVPNVLSFKHSSTLSREGRDPAVAEQQYDRDHKPFQTWWTNPIPVDESKISHSAELPHQSGNAFTPSSSNNSPHVNQHASSSRPLSSYSAACGSKESLLETSSQDGPATCYGPEGVVSHIHLQQLYAGNRVGVWEPQSSTQNMYEVGMASPQFRGCGSSGGTSDAVYNVAAATSAPADQNDRLIVGEWEDLYNKSGHCVDGSIADDEFDELLLEWQSPV